VSAKVCSSRTKSAPFERASSSGAVGALFGIGRWWMIQVAPGLNVSVFLGTSRMRPRGIVALVVATGCIASCGTPTEPDGRSGLMYLALVYTGDGIAPMACKAIFKCRGL